MAGTATFGAVTDHVLLSIVNDPAAVRTDARVEPFGKPAHLVASTTGLAVVGARAADAYRWSEVRRVRVRRGTLVIEMARTLVLRPTIDDVPEPLCAATLAAVLDELRQGRFSTHGTAWHEHLNAIDRLRGEFSDQDDAVLPIAAAGLWLSVGLMLMFVIAAVVNATLIRAVPAGSFSLIHRVGPLDPRAVVAAFALSALVTTVVLRLALGRQAAIWARGAARGWHERGGRVRGLAMRALGRLVLGSGSAAAVALLALLLFWPNVAATVLIERSGIRNDVLLPFVSLEQPWRAVNGIERTPAGGVRYHFADGTELWTDGLSLGGGTPLQLYELSVAWRVAAR
ncbi:MAG TPA: hypothetical protein VFM06_12620 [Candidatus Limnocylindria bacterium]|nr:hypothetical protein [Candidatus Limnocylindria bacterium]